MRLNVRQANLDLDLRGLFEQYGEQVVAFALALGSMQGTGIRTHPSRLLTPCGSFTRIKMQPRSGSQNGEISRSVKGPSA